MAHDMEQDQDQDAAVVRRWLAGAMAELPADLIAGFVDECLRELGEHKPTFH